MRKYLRQIARARLAKMGVKKDRAWKHAKTDRRKSGFASVWRSVVGNGEWAEDARNAQLGTGKKRLFRLAKG